MKVLHLSFYGPDGKKGGAIATRRLHFGLRQAGIDSIILNKQAADKNLHFELLRTSRIEKKISALLKKLILSRVSLNSLEGLGYLQIKKSKAYLDADIIHFHRIFDFFSYLALPFLTENKPSILTISDMWPYTGHCYNSLDCERWKTGCGKCPYPDMPPSINHDNTQIEWKIKNWVYRHADLNVITNSTCSTDQVRKSMLKHFPIHFIPIGIDTSIYRPLDKKQCQSMLGIPPGKWVLAFVAANLDNYIKGADLLLKALNRLPKSLKKEIVLIVLGDKGNKLTKNLDIQNINFGYIANDHLKTIFYSAADLFICPTRGENFGIVLLESMACGTPMVSFKVGGVPDLVRPGITGYLAETDQFMGLYEGIIELLENDQRRESMSKKCREIALNEFRLELMVERHTQLYKQLL